MQIKALIVLLPLFLSPAAAMGKASNILAEFIDEIPASSLTGLPTSGRTIYTTDDFRLDMQGVSSIPRPQNLPQKANCCFQLTTASKKQPQAHNLQIQANKQSSIKQISKMAPATVAGPVLVPVKDPWDAETVRAKFKASMKI